MIRSWPADDLRFNTSRGSRWYRDSLPACDLVPDAGEPFEVPAWTTVANAWPKFLTKWAANTAARCAVNERSHIATLSDTDAERYIASAPDRHRDSAASRGTGIHRLLEQIAEGREPAVDLFPKASAFVDTMKAFVGATRPRWLCSEAVTFNRRLKVAGTADGFLSFDAMPELGVRVVDFKTKAHKDRIECYPDHALQVVLHADADYLIGDVDGKPARLAVPQVDGGLIVIITEHDWHLFPIETDERARGMVATLRAMWDVTRDAKSLIGKPVKPDTVPAVDLLAERAFLVERIAWLKAEHPAAVQEIAKQWPFGVPTLKQSNDHTADQLAVLRVVVEQAEATCRVPFREEPNQPPVTQLSDLDVDRQHRVAQAKEHLASAVGDDTDMAQALVAATGATSLTALTALQGDVLHSLCLAVIGDVITLHCDENGWTLRCDVNESLFVDTCGSKALALAAAREAAASLGVPAPRSAAAIREQPVIAAVVAARAPAAA